MDKRTIIGIVLCMFVLVGWNYFAEFMGWRPPQNQQTTQQPSGQQAGQPDIQNGGQSNSANPAANTGSSPQIAPAGANLASGKVVIVDTPLYKAKFSDLGGILLSFELKLFTVRSQYATVSPQELVNLVEPKTAPAAPLGILINNQQTWRNAAWSYTGSEHITLGANQKDSLTFIGNLGSMTLKRTITFDAANYVLQENLELYSQTPQVVSLGYSLSTADLFGPEDYQKITQVARVQANEFNEESDRSTLANGQSYGTNITWAGNMSNYFLAALLPSDPNFRMDARFQNDVFTIALKRDDINIAPETPLQSSISYYFGPKHTATLHAAPVDLTTSIDYGWFAIISRPLVSLLLFINSFVGNYGVTIIILTILVKMVLWPLSYKSYKSMQSMKMLQPHMQKLREKYAGDKQRLNAEVMQLYKTYKINPMGGCFPIFLQLPVFIGLYKALLYAFELRQASFIPYLPFTDNVWLADLSIADPYYITPLIMGATMFIQQKLTPTPGDPTQAKIMLIMPIVFTFMFLNFPSGLVVYWLISNLFSIGQQQWQFRQHKTA
jgi:YidC/Oxa1 family membrane protein insertase